MSSFDWSLDVSSRYLGATMALASLISAKGKGMRGLHSIERDATSPSQPVTRILLIALLGKTN